MKYQFSTPLSYNLNKLGFKPSVIDYWIRLFAPSFSIERVFARVKDIRQEAHNVKTIFFKPNFNFKNFKAGQHILVTFTINGRNITRTYSPTDHSRQIYSITVKDAHPHETQNGFFLSSALNQALQVGDLIEISQPFGEITWDNIPTSEQYIFCAGGVGITPFYSLLNDPKSLTKKINLLYWVNKSEETCYRSEFDKMKILNPQFNFQIFALDEKTNLSQKPNHDHFKSTNLHKAVVIACGPQGFIQSILNLTSPHNVQFLAESIVNKKQPSTEEVFHHLHYNGQTYSISNQQTILEALEMHGLHPKHGCRMGICKSCTCTKVKGLTENLMSGEQSIEDQDEIQICVSRSQSDIEIKNL